MEEEKNSKNDESEQLKRDANTLKIDEEQWKTLTPKQQELIGEIKVLKFWKEPLVRHRVRLLNELKPLNKSIKKYTQQIARLAEELQENKQQ